MKTRKTKSYTQRTMLGNFEIEATIMPGNPVECEIDLVDLHGKDVTGVLIELDDASLGVFEAMEKRVLKEVEEDMGA